MKITHNPHGDWQRPSAAVDPGYEAEVQASTTRSEREYRRRKQRLAHAEEKLAKARASSQTRVNKKHIAELVALAELRREELEEYRRMMVAVAASAEHRGTRSYRPVPGRDQASGL